MDENTPERDTLKAPCSESWQTKPSHAITLRDIAEALGLDVSTVSRGMRNDPRITPVTRNRIQGMAATLGYRQNPFVNAFAAQLRTRCLGQASARIAVVYAQNGSERKEWFSCYLNGIRAGAESQGFGIDVLGFSIPELDSGAFLKVLRARGIRGVILMPVPVEAVRLHFSVDGFAAATIDQSLVAPALHRASPDYFRGMRLALDVLRDSGFRRIGFYTNPQELARIGRRWEGAYLQWQTTISPEDRLPIHMDPDTRTRDSEPLPDPVWKTFRDAFFDWFDRNRPDAIVSNQHHFVRWLKAHGVNIPGDVMPIALGAPVPGTDLPGIDQQPERIGREAVNLVTSQIFRNEYGPPSCPVSVLVPPVWRAV